MYDSGLVVRTSLLAERLRRPDLTLIAILVIAGALRLHLAATESYLHDEENTAIPLADTISFTPGRLHLPLRGENHGALPAYVVHVSRVVFGTSRLATRIVHVALGLATIVMIALLVRRQYGAVASQWAAALMAFNEFYIEVSSRATAHVPHLFFATLAIVAVARFLDAQRPGYLYLAGAALGLAFYCKEHSALLLPVFFIVLMVTGHRRWLRSVHPYAALGVFVLVVSPDLLWNVRSPGETLVGYGDQTARQATYGSHLQRIGGLGLSPYPSMFYARSAVIPLHEAMTGRTLTDETPEYDAINPALGVLLVGAVLLTTLGRPAAPATMLLVAVFWSIFAFFTFITKGNPPGRLDPVSWIWVEITLVPAVILGGLRLADAKGAWRVAAWTCAVAALAYAAWTPSLGVLEFLMASLREGVGQVSHAFQELAMATVDAVRQRPLRWLAGGGAAGAILGLAAGWWLRAWRDRSGQV